MRGIQLVTVGFPSQMAGNKESISRSWCNLTSHHMYHYNDIIIKLTWKHNRLSLQWHHNEHDGVSNHQPHDCLLDRLFKHRSKKTSKLHVTGLCVGNSPVTSEFPAQRASNAENVFHLMTSSCYISVPVAGSPTQPGQQTVVFHKVKAHRLQLTSTLHYAQDLQL